MSSGQTLGAGRQDQGHQSSWGAFLPPRCLGILNPIFWSSGPLILAQK